MLHVLLLSTYRYDPKIGRKAHDQPSQLRTLESRHLTNASAKLAGVDRIVYGGSTLYDNPRIVETVRLFSTVMGFEAIVLPRSGHAGALGAMLLAA